jgi:hypothetical protein
MRRKKKKGEIKEVVVEEEKEIVEVVVVEVVVEEEEVVVEVEVEEEVAVVEVVVVEVVAEEEVVVKEVVVEEEKEEVVVEEEVVKEEVEELVEEEKKKRFTTQIHELSEYIQIMNFHCIHVFVVIHKISKITNFKCDYLDNDNPFLIFGKFIKNETFFVFTVNSESLSFSRKLRMKLAIFKILCITTKT